jgi:Uma2 family endonuclease
MTSQILTAEQYARLPENKMYRDELIRGFVCVREPGPPGFSHGDIDGHFGYLLSAFVMPRRLGRVVHNTGFVLERNPDTVCGPDISFMAAERVPDQVDTAYLPGAPDLAVEILSRSNSKKDTAWHVAIYLRTGARLVWVVDPRKHTITVNRPNIQPEILGANDMLSGHDVLPGFQCRVADVFDPYALAGS